MLEELRKRYPDAETFTFGDSRALCDDLLALVRSGAKTATCSALRDFTEGGEALPKPGRRDIALDWDKRPALVIETVSVEILRYCDVPESFALAEGENDNLVGWRDGHRRYFERNGGFDPEMQLVCERFRLIEDLAQEGGEAP
ncbi:ASCH domain-containing protein [Tropicimonas marinistellae]|uniref:ASCH domain-containing protein n=1 Tax=Tropicimonas marinistellae TaxID=1739787 RepID=UPI000829B9BA|nr:ASCH domain-containing protein [Tropicimonas marinistellae]